MRAAAAEGGGAVNPDQRMRLRLLPAQWVLLPGTGWQVYLHGKAHGPGSDGVEIVRTHVRTEVGGWDLEQVLNQIFLRKAR